MKLQEKEVVKVDKFKYQRSTINELCRQIQFTVYSTNYSSCCWDFLAPQGQKKLLACSQSEVKDGSVTESEDLRW